MPGADASPPAPSMSIGSQADPTSGPLAAGTPAGVFGPARGVAD